MSLPGSYSLYGTANAPTAGTVVVSIPGVAAGVYVCTVWALLSGTLAAGDQDNIRLQVPAVGGGQQNSQTILLVPTANVWAPPLVIGRLIIGANGAVSVNAVGAATAGSVYRAFLNLDPLVG